jgi:nucleoid-associated protein YgaU
MALAPTSRAKLLIIPDNVPGTALETVEAMFNPGSYTITKSVTWNRANDARANAPTVTFGGGSARELALELFFDVTEVSDPNRDVRTETDKLVKMTRILRSRETPRPPTCRVEWDRKKSADFPFRGVISTLTQRFTLFNSNGRPLRATVNVSITEFLKRTDDLKDTDPELSTRTVQRGDDLPRIAAEVYLDPTVWRVIALANRIEDPFELVVGSVLTLPKR